VSFVDDPRQAVSDAEALVSDVIDDMTAGFRQQRQQLESLWNQGHQVSTEQLRQAIQRYRDFFERFLRV
jgi:flagellar basal body rod protein FlgF